jgi:hypothetical protein
MAAMVLPMSTLSPPSKSWWWGKQRIGKMYREKLGSHYKDTINHIKNKQQASPLVAPL